MIGAPVDPAVTSIAAALLAAIAVALAGPRRRRAGIVPKAAASRSDDGAIARWRLPLCTLCGVGAYLFFGGLLGVAAALGAAGYAWRLLGAVATAADMHRMEELRRDLPGAVDLLVSAFRVGLAPGPALALVGAALPGAVQEEFVALSRRLELGADPADVWLDLAEHDQLGALGRALGRAHARGAAVVPAGERLADELRERSAAEVEARARSVSTKAAAPLGACFLPAFVLLGIVPLVGSLIGALQLFR